MSKNNKIDSLKNHLTHSGITLTTLNRANLNTINDLIGLKFTAIGKDFMQAELPVDKRTRQPYGLLHGGASATLLETLGSVASYLLVESKAQHAVGIEINANHVRGVGSGKVIGTVRALHIGHTTHVWEVRIHNDKQQLVSVGRLTTMIMPNP